MSFRGAKSKRGVLPHEKPQREREVSAVFQDADYSDMAGEERCVGPGITGGAGMSHNDLWWDP